MMIDAEPPLIDDAKRNAFIGGAAEHLARRWDLRIPSWTDDRARFLKEPWLTTTIEELKPLPSRRARWSSVVA